MTRLSYALVTPARNEEEFIGQTIESVVRQTVRPLKWVIVSDGSTDRTDDIVRKHAAEHPWIELVRLPERASRHFAGKVHAFNAGYARLKDVPYALIGSLDADITFSEDFFQFLIDKFVQNPRLGLGGTPFKEAGKAYDFRFSSVEHVSGACQLFRRECFEAIGGYVPVKGGGIDVIAVLSARMKGWETRTFPEKNCHHHRPMGSGNNRGLRMHFALGEKDYRLGRHPVWQLFRSLYQMTRRPFVLGGSALLAGFVWSMVARRERPVSRELIEFQRREQMDRLKNFLGLKTLRPSAVSLGEAGRATK